MKALKILGMGRYLPERIVSSSELEEEWGLEPGWIQKKNGVEQRHYAAPHESCAYMGGQALKQALERANVEFQELDLIIEASGSFDHPIPHDACFLPSQLGFPDHPVACWNVDSTCLSFVTALDMLSYMLDGQRYKKVAVVSSEIASKSLDPSHPKTASLFGDGAAAAIIGLPEEGEEAGVIAADMITISSGATYTMVPGGGNVLHPSTSDKKADFCFKMEGSKVMKLGLQHGPSFIQALLEKAGLQASALDLFIPHQASKMAMEALQRLFKFPAMVDILSTHGNCISASIPLALESAISTGRLKRGDLCCLFGTAAGLSFGGLVLRY
jgi:3-oxoacyl-[acyl-carrier-protein] synthase-3